MPEGRQRSQRIEAFERVLSDVIEHRFVSFDKHGAKRAAELFAERQKRGRPVEMRDTMIAGIVLASHAKLATRNLKHFEDIATSVVNPWEA
jgi:predicted nucleic acid-binding protein